MNEFTRKNHRINCFLKPFWFFFSINQIIKLFDFNPIGNTLKVMY